MPEFELDLTNVESEVVDGVTVVKAAELTAVSLAGGSVTPGAAERITAWAQPVSAEEAGANFREAVRKLQRHEGNTAEEMRQAGDGIRAMADSVAVLGIGSVVKAAADAEAEAERERRALEPLAERPPLEITGNGYRRSCAHCDYHQVTHIGVTAEAQHMCRRDGVTYLIMWPRG